jgi:signal transduction histidine kinase/CheY-like chemotaxis protein
MSDTLQQIVTDSVVDVDDRKRLQGASRVSDDRLAADLEAMTRLHALSTRLLTCSNLRAGLDDVLENAIRTCGADFGNIQLYNPRTASLEIAVHRGFLREFLDYFHSVRVDEGSACAQAMKSGDRIVIPDVQLDPEFAPHRAIAASAGYRAVQSTPLKNARGGIVGMLSTHFREPQGLSERDGRLLDLYARHAADFLDRLRFEEVLKEADRRKDEFLATLAHELRNPLAPLRNGLHLLRLSGKDAGVAEQTLEIMERQLGQMVHLVDDLLDVSRISRGKVELRTTRVKLADIVSSALESVKPLIEVRSHQLSVSLPPAPIWLDADPTRLAQVIANVLDNAAKYTPPSGRIALSAVIEEAELVIRVCDSGIGISAEMLPRVFEMFTQVDRSLERTTGGLGIGLTLVERFVALHGGKVEAYSDGPGRGSEFVIRLTNIAQPPAVPSHNGHSARAASSPRRILLVEDNRDSANSLALALRLQGHDVQTAYDGADGLAAADTFRPEVAILDIGLPRLNGYQIARRLREEPWGKAMLLLALTGWGQDDDRRQAQAAGFDHHLTKPVDNAALDRLLAHVVPSPTCLSS